MKSLSRSAIAAAAVALSAHAAAAIVSDESDTTYRTNVSSARVAVGPPAQRCWMEKEAQGSNVNVTGAVAGGVVGGIIGHQVGRGKGKTAGTIGGAAIGSAVGSQIGRKSAQAQEIERCETAASDSPDIAQVTE